MIMIFTALYCEAQPMIQHYDLIKNKAVNKFQLFENNGIRLAVTNPGSIASAVGVSYFCTLYPPSASDFLVNMGVCGTGNKEIPRGSMFLCNKITEAATNRSFFPDVIFRHPFEESGIITCSTIVKEPDRQQEGGERAELFDMEAAAVYQAAAYFFQPHQLFFLKTVSDYGDGSKPAPKEISRLMERNMDSLAHWLDTLARYKPEDRPGFTPEEENCIRDLGIRLHFSVAMEHKLRQLLHYYKLSRGGITEAVHDFLADIRLPCAGKLEGKMYFEQLKARLL